MKIVWHKHNLLISFSVVSGHPGKYSYEIPHEYLQGWGKLLGKIKRNRFFFSNSDFPSRICCHFFQDSFILAQATFSHFFWVPTSIQQLLFQDIYFFRTAAVLSFFTYSEQSLFRRIYFFRIASFLERKFYRAATSWEYKVLYSNYFSEQLFRRNFLG